VLLVGSGAAEVEYCASLAGRERVVDGVNRLSLDETIQALAGARLVLSNDSAPLHVALNLDVPVVALFGPTHPATYVDLGRARLRVHYSGIYCSPCLQYWDPPPCGGFNRCMQSISEEAVLRSCRELLAGDEGPGVLVPAEAREDSRYFPGLVYAKGP
jgi:heptosyltransferase-2